MGPELVSELLTRALEYPLATALVVVGALLLLALLLTLRARARRRANKKLAAQLTGRVLTELKREQFIFDGHRAAPSGATPERALRDRQEIRVRLFIDFPNFGEPLRQSVAKHGRTRQIEWSRLPKVLLKRLVDLAAVPEHRLRLVGSYVYDSFIPYQTLVEHGEHGHAETWYRYDDKKFLIETLATMPGFFVHLSDRTLKMRHGAPVRNSMGAMVTQEKAVDTRLTTDLLMGAFNDTYDIALLLSDDNDYVPPAEAVYERFGIIVVHVGFHHLSRGLGAASWAEILVDAKLAQSLRKEDGLRSLLRVNSSDGRPPGTQSSVIVTEAADEARPEAFGIEPAHGTVIVGQVYDAVVRGRPPRGLVVEIENLEHGSVNGLIRWNQVKRVLGEVRLLKGDRVRVKVTAVTEKGALCTIEHPPPSPAADGNALSPNPLTS